MSGNTPPPGSHQTNHLTDGKLEKPNFLANLQRFGTTPQSIPPITPVVAPAPVMGGSFFQGNKMRSQTPGGHPDRDTASRIDTILGAGTTHQDAMIEEQSSDSSQPETRPNDLPSWIPDIALDGEGTVTETPAPQEETAMNVVEVPKDATRRVAHLKNEHLQSLLKHAKVSTELLIQLFEFNPSQEGAMELMTKSLNEIEIVRVWQIGRDKIINRSEFWNLAIQKIDLNRITPGTLLTLCADAKVPELWAGTILTRKFDSNTLIDFLVDSNFHEQVLEAILNEKLIECGELIEMIKSHENTEGVSHGFSVSLFNYLQKVRTSNIGVEAWHTSLINIAIQLDRATFWSMIASEISSEAN